MNFNFILFLGILLLLVSFLLEKKYYVCNSSSAVIGSVLAVVSKLFGVFYVLISVVGLIFY